MLCSLLIQLSRCLIIKITRPNFLLQRDCMEYHGNSILPAWHSCETELQTPSVKHLLPSFNSKSYQLNTSRSPLLNSNYLSRCTTVFQSHLTVKRWSSLPGSFNDVRVPTPAIHWSIELIGNWMSNYYEWMNSDTTSLSFLHTDPPCYDHRLTLCLGMAHFFILIQCY